jgi:hypothetical protein
MSFISQHEVRINSLKKKAESGEKLTDEERLELWRHLESIKHLLGKPPQMESGTEMLGEEKVGLKKPDKP